MQIIVIILYTATLCYDMVAAETILSSIAEAGVGSLTIYVKDRWEHFHGYMTLVTANGHTWL